MSDISIFERYTESARSSVSFARQEAQHRGASAITVADLLAGLSVEEDSRAERIGSLKSNAFYLRWLVGLPPLPARASESIERPDNAAEEPLELDEESRRALSYAWMEADRDREYWIDSDHLLRGILRFPNRAHFAILKTEVDLRSARIASRHDREVFLPRRTPGAKVFQYLVRKHIALWMLPILGLACYAYILVQGIWPVLAPLTR